MTRALLCTLFLLATPAAGLAERDAQPKPGADTTAPGKASVEDKNAALLLAYQREYAFLNAEKRALQVRLTEAKEDAEARKAAARREIAVLEQRLVGLSVEADAAERGLEQQERNAEGEEDAATALSSLLAQARSLLGRETLGADADGVDASAVGTAFQGAAQMLARRAAVRQEPGAFFDAAGKKIDGALIKLGEVATFGVAPDSAGPLAPAGAGQLKLWAAGRSADARALQEGRAPARLELFLYESLDKAIEPRKEKTPLEIVEAGGTIAWVIFGLGLAALLLVLLRLLALGSAGAGAGRLLEEISARVRLGELDEAERTAKQGRGAMAAVLRATLEGRTLSREARADRVDEQVLRSFALIDRFGTLILVMAAVAPLLGLLGTVTGMIATFDAITEFGTGDPRVLAGGISEALITTELGLLVAIPSLLLGNLLSGLGERMKRSLETGALSVANLCDEGRDLSVIDEVETA